MIAVADICLTLGNYKFMESLKSIKVKIIYKERGRIKFNGRINLNYESKN